MGTTALREQDVLDDCHGGVTRTSPAQQREGPINALWQIRPTVPNRHREATSGFYGIAHIRACEALLHRKLPRPITSVHGLHWAYLRNATVVRAAGFWNFKVLCWNEANNKSKLCEKDTLPSQDCRRNAR